MDALVYLLCAATAALCALLLLRGYRRNRARLLLWSGACFVLLTFDNLLLFADRSMVPQINMAPWRSLTALVAVGVLLYGLIWEARS